MKKKKIVSVSAIIIIILLGFNGIYTAYEDAVNPVDSRNFYKSKEDIREKWNNYRPKHKGKIYKEKPRATYPYKIGKLESDFIQDGVNMANFVR